MVTAKQTKTEEKMAMPAADRALYRFSNMPITPSRLLLNRIPEALGKIKA